jgi:hypothetical protein
LTPDVGQYAEQSFLPGVFGGLAGRQPAAQLGRQKRTEIGSEVALGLRVLRRQFCDIFRIENL